MTNNEYLNSRYARFVVLPSIGKAGMEKIRNARATVVGAGGLGSVTTTQLTALGIGRLRIIDKDLVELSNLQRQFLYREEDIGQPKVEVAKSYLETLNPDVEIEAVREEISSKNVEIVSDSTDFVVDGMDRFSPRFVVNRECLKKDLPYLFAAVSRQIGNVKTVMRGEGPCIECISGHVDDSALPTTSETGVHPAIISLIGSIQIAEATKIMVGEKPALLDRLQFCDLETVNFEVLKIKPKKDCFCSKYRD